MSIKKWLLATICPCLLLTWLTGCSFLSFNPYESNDITGAHQPNDIIDLQLDPPALSDFPDCTTRLEVDSDDFQNALWYGEYSFEGYTAEEMDEYLQNAALFRPMTEEDIDAFYTYHHDFETALAECEAAGTSYELIDAYFVSGCAVTKAIIVETDDYFYEDAYGFFVYQTDEQMLYGLQK